MLFQGQLCVPPEIPLTDTNETIVVLQREQSYEMKLKSFNL